MTNHLSQVRLWIATAVALVALLTVAGSATASKPSPRPSLPANVKGTKDTLSTVGQRHHGHRTLGRRAGKQKRASAAATIYNWTVRSPAATCYDDRVSTSQVSVSAPLVYAADEPGQWVYWRSYLYDAATRQIQEIGPLQSAWVTRTSSAAFTYQSYAIYRGRSVRAGAEVFWYSPRYGWHNTWRNDLPFTSYGRLIGSVC